MPGEADDAIGEVVLLDDLTRERQRDRTGSDDQDVLDELWRADEQVEGEPPGQDRREQGENNDGKNAPCSTATAGSTR